MFLMSSSITKIANALLEAQKNMGNATKDSKNPFFKSSYADLNSVREAVTPALNAHGISVLQPTVILGDGSAAVQTTLMHSSGEYMSSTFPIIAAKANDPQAFGSAVSYARRYALQSFLSVGAVDDDSEAAMGRKATTTVTSSTAVVATTAPTTTAPARSSFQKKSVTTTVAVGDDI